MSGRGVRVSRLFRRYRSDLACSRCEAVVAHVDLRLFVRPRLEDTEGRRIPPSGA